MKLTFYRETHYGDMHIWSSRERWSLRYTNQRTFDTCYAFVNPCAVSHCSSSLDTSLRCPVIGLENLEERPTFALGASEADAGHATAILPAKICVEKSQTRKAALRTLTSSPLFKHPSSTVTPRKIQISDLIRLTPANVESSPQPISCN